MKCFACGTEPDGVTRECKCGGTRVPPDNPATLALVAKGISAGYWLGRSKAMRWQCPAHQKRWTAEQRAKEDPHKWDAMARDVVGENAGRQRPDGARRTP